MVKLTDPKYIKKKKYLRLFKYLLFPVPFPCQVCEHCGSAPVPKDSWSLYLLGAQRSQKLEITESSEAFSPDLYPGSEFHSTFIHMLQDNMSSEGIARTRESSYLFVDTVQSLLCATRPLMFS